MKPKEKTMAEAENAAAPKKSKWATMIETSQAINRKREGKTQADHQSGAWRRTLDNQTARGNWTRSGGATYGKGDPFPIHTLGGKGNSSLPFKMCGGRGRTQDHRQKRG